MENAAADSRSARAAALADLAHLPGVTAALERDDVNALHAALERARKTHPAERRRIDELLATPRLFLIPSGPPSLRTLNGIGARLWGRFLPDPASGTYASLYCVVFVFLPVFPLERYLVSSAGDGSYFFYGALPPTRGMRLWRRLVGALAASAAAAGAVALYLSATHADVHVLNALDVPVEVTLGEATVHVAPHGREALETPVGPLHVAVRRTDGRALEELDVEVPRFTDLVVYNVAGAAPLYVEDVVYRSEAAGGSDAAPAGTAYAGQRFVVRDDVEDVFRPVPPEIRTKADRVVRRHAEVAEGNRWQATVNHLLEEDRPEVARAVMRAVVLGEPENREAIAGAVELGGLARTKEEHEARIGLFRELIALVPGSVDAHRAYQEAMGAAGRDEELRVEYRARYEREPTADHAYLLQRALPHAEALPLATEFSARFPEHGRLAIAHGWQLATAGRWAESASAFERAARVAPDLARELFLPRLRALAGAGRIEDAFRLADATDGPFDLAETAAYAGLVRLRPEAAPHPELHLLLRTLGDEKPEPGVLAAVRQDLGDELSDEAVAAVGAEDGVAEVVGLYREILRDPAEALRRFGALREDLRPRLRAPFALLLAGEATRAGDAATAEHLVVPFGSSAPELVAWLREGVPFDDGDPEVRGLALVARARVVGSGVEGARLAARVRAIDPLGNLAASAATRWFEPAAGKTVAAAH